MKFLLPYLTSAFRHALTAIGGYLVAKGIATQETVDQASGPIIEIGIGLVSYLLGQGLSLVKVSKK